MQRKILYEAQKGKCFLCGNEMSPWSAKKVNGAIDNGYTRDHVIPKSKGGKIRKNIVLVHQKCNSRRGNKDPSEDMLRYVKELWALAKKIERDFGMMQPQDDWRIYEKNAKSRMVPEIAG